MFTMSMFIGMISCKSTPSNTMSSFYSKSVECVGVDIYGNEIVQTKVLAKSQKEALLKAQDKALETVLFLGLVDEVKGCFSKPLIGGANVRERNKSYFDDFFKKRGSYKKFVSVQNVKVISNEIRNGVKYDMYGIEVNVARKDLENKLVKDNIIIKHTTNEK